MSARDELDSDQVSSLHEGERGPAVVILGAGASRAYETSPTSVQLPLARDLASTFLELEVSRHPWIIMYGLFAYLEHYRNIGDPIAFLRGSLDMEEFHSEIEEELWAAFAAGDEVKTLLTFKAFHELISLFAITVNTIQSGPPSSVHQRLARCLRATDTIVTFNWDTLADRALASETAWCPDVGYGVSPKSIFEDGWRAPTKEIAPESAPTLLKLHGSANWITSYPVFEKGRFALTHASAPENFYVHVAASRPYDCWAGRYMDGYGPYAFGYYPPNVPDTGTSAPEGYVFIRGRWKFPWMPEGKGGESGVTSIPLLIPPVKRKKYDLYGELFATIWKEAEDRIAGAERIIVIGYSFPRTDHRSSDLFLQAFRRRSTIPRVVIVNPDPRQVVEKFRYELGVPDSHLEVRTAPFSASYDVASLLVSV